MQDRIGELNTFPTSENDVEIQASQDQIAKDSKRFWLTNAAVILPTAAIGVYFAYEGLGQMINPNQITDALAAAKFGFGTAALLFAVPTFSYCRLRYGTWFGPPN